MRQKFFAVSIINYHSADLTLRLLKDLPMAWCDVFILDNASGDEEYQKIQKATCPYEHVFTIYNKKNRGFAGGNNDNRKHIESTGSYQYILFLNPDITLSDNFLQEFMEEIITHQQQHPKTIAYGPIMQSKLGGKLITYFGSKVNPWIIQGYNNTNCKRMPDFISGCCLAMKFDLPYKTYFDDMFFLYYEEVDLCFTARKSGYNLHITGQTVYHHQDYLKNTKPYFLYTRNRSRLLFAKKRAKWYARPTISFRSGCIIFFYFLRIGPKKTKHILKGMYHGITNKFDTTYFT